MKLAFALSILLLLPLSSTAQDIQFPVMETNTNGVLNITHTPINSSSVGKQIHINASVISLFGALSVRLFHKGVNASLFNETDMTLISGDSHNGTWNGTIPGQRKCGKLYYYLRANDTKGNSVTEPKNISEPFEVLIVDTLAPMIYHLRVESSYGGSPIPLWAIIADDVGVKNVTLCYRRHEESKVCSLKMNISEGNSLYANWTATIPPQTGGVLWYWINATDGTNNVTTGNISIIVEQKYSKPPDKDWLTIITISLCIALLIIAIILFKVNRKRKKKTKPVQSCGAKD